MAYENTASPLIIDINYKDVLQKNKKKVTATLPITCLKKHNTYGVGEIFYLWL